MRQDEYHIYLAQLFERSFKLLKRWFSFQFQASSSRCEDLIKAYPRCKNESRLIYHWENIIAYWGRIWAKLDVSKQLWFVPNRKGGGFKAVTTVQFQENFQIFIRVWAWKQHFQPPSLSHVPCLKDYLLNLTKNESKSTSKIQISRLFSELGKHGSTV